MEIRDGALIFRAGEAGEIANVFTDQAIVHQTRSLDPEATEAQPAEAQSLVRALHGVITDSRLPESRREEATNQLMHIALTGLRSSIDEHDRSLRHQRAIALTSAL